MTQIKLTSFTANHKLEAVLRETRMRRRLYPRRVKIGAMTQAEADHEIAVMEAIAADYRAKAELPLETRP